MLVCVLSQSPPRYCVVSVSETIRLGAHLPVTGMREIDFHLVRLSSTRDDIHNLYSSLRILLIVIIKSRGEREREREMGRIESRQDFGGNAGWRKTTRKTWTWRDNKIDRRELG